MFICLFVNAITTFILRIKTVESYNGKPLLRKRERDDVWLRFVTVFEVNFWVVSDTREKDARQERQI